MGKVVKLNEEFVERVTREAKAQRRSVPKQIEFYYKITAAALENPDLSVEWVRDLLISKEVNKAKEVKWLDEALVRTAGKQKVKEAAGKSKRASSRSASRNPKKSISR